MQYTTDNNLKIRQQTHAQYTIGQPLEDWLDTQLHLESNAALLDIGTANGAFPKRLHQAGHSGRLVGIDLSSGMIELAKQQTNLEFFVADAQELPFSDNTFDVITARHMLYHVPDIQKALLEAKRVLKPDGYFFALTNADGYLADYWGLIQKTLSNTPEIQPFLEEITSPKFFHNHLEQHIQSVFGKTELMFLHQFLEFTSVTAPLAYWNSMQSGHEISTEVWQQASLKLEVAFTQKTEKPWRIQKDVVLLTARK